LDSTQKDLIIFSPSNSGTRVAGLLFALQGSAIGRLAPVTVTIFWGSDRLVITQELPLNLGKQKF